MMYSIFTVLKYDYIWTYDILLICIFIYYWNNYVIIMHDTDKIEVNGFLNDTYILHGLYWQLHMEVNLYLYITFVYDFYTILYE